MRYAIAIFLFVVLLLLARLAAGCSPSVAVHDVFDASVDAAELDAVFDAPECPSPNPGPVPCEDTASCPVVAIDSCGEWSCPKPDGGLSYCEWRVKGVDDGG